MEYGYSSLTDFLQRWELRCGYMIIIMTVHHVSTNHSAHFRWKHNCKWRSSVRYSFHVIYSLELRKFFPDYWTACNQDNRTRILVCFYVKPLRLRLYCYPMALLQCLYERQHSSTPLIYPRGIRWGWSACVPLPTCSPRWAIDPCSSPSDPARCPTGQPPPSSPCRPPALCCIPRASSGFPSSPCDCPEADRAEGREEVRGTRFAHLMK